ncbi:hypothetical protein KJ359_009715 [Pestalotiopsis sp. 9143b]|nr:hypothetical protein KJ359_009715 [Pestalotiopsis sp. 9143b]
MLRNTPRRSARVSHQDGGIPLPPARVEAYGENTIFAPSRDGRKRLITEEENDARNQELYDQMYGSKDVEIPDLATTSPLDDAIDSIHNPRRKGRRTHPGGKTSQATPRNDDSQSDDDLFLPSSYRKPVPKNAGYYEHDPWNLHNEVGNRNLYVSDLQNPYQTPYNGKSHPSEPADSLASKWGMAGGRPTPVPLSARSFLHEDHLFNSANLASPSTGAPLRMSARRKTQAGPRLNGQTSLDDPPPPPPPRTEDPAVKHAALEKAKREKEALEKAEREKAQREKAAAEEAARRKAELEEAERQKVALKKAELESAERERAALEEAERKKIEAKKAELAEAERKKLELKKLQAKKAELERLERERAALEEAERKKVEAKRAEQKAEEAARKAAASKASTSKDPPPDPEKVDPTRVQALRDRLAPSEFQGHTGPKPFALRDDLTEADKDKAERFRHWMFKGVQGPVMPSPAWTKPANPTYPPIPPTNPKTHLPPPLSTAGSSLGARMVNRAQGFGWWGYNLIKDYFLPLIILLLGLLLFQAYRSFPNRDSLSTGGGFSLPNLSLPTWGGSVRSKELQEIFHRLDGIDLDLEQIHSSLDALKSGVRPDEDGRQVFWVNKDKNGALVIPQDYYQAIKQSILKDKDILKGVSSETWSPLINRLVASGYLNDLPPGNDWTFEDISNSDLNSAWELWLRQNDAAILKALGGELDKNIASMTEKELKAFLEQHNINGNGGKLVTRKEFEELYQKEIKGGYSDKLEELVGEVNEFKDSLAQLKASPPQGLSAGDLDKVVDAAVKKYTDTLKIEAAAKSGSSAVLSQLSSQVNYFSAGAGARTDPELTSPIWKPPKPAFKSKQFWDVDGHVNLPPSAVLLPWEEEGDCFCAGPRRNGQGAGTANVSISISRDIVPRYLVVEHILPGATLDPGARPKDMEVWAYYEDHHLRETVEAWSRSRWPETVSEQVLHGGYVKIAGFTYEEQRTGDGSQIHTLSSELSDMEAVSNVYVRGEYRRGEALDHA